MSDGQILTADQCETLGIKATPRRKFLLRREGTPKHGYHWVVRRHIPQIGMLELIKDFGPEYPLAT